MGVSENVIVGREAIKAPCSNACPAGIDVPRYIRLASEGKFDEALAVVMDKIPFPSVCGYVCFHPCERKCQMCEMGGPVAIKAIKRFIAEKAPRSRFKEPMVAKSTGKRVAVAGSGPAGLTAAYYLAKLGHKVTVFEALPKPGGMMRVGIPEYRLPRQILDAEIEDIKRVGVEIRTSTRVDSIESLFNEGYDATFLAIGAHQGIKMGIEGEDNPNVKDRVSFLRDVNSGKEVELGKKVAVIGGGNAAIDSARTALRLGAKEAIIIYRRTRAEMPASAEEIEEALAEGVKVYFLAAPSRIISRDGEPELECLRMELGEVDASGRRRPEPVEGSEFSMSFNTVIAAIGQRPEIPKQFGLTIGQGNTIQVDPDTLATDREGVFAGGDATTGPASVIEAIAAGRQAVISIDKYLGGEGVIEEARARLEEAGPQLLEPPIKERVMIPTLPVDERFRGFALVELTLDEESVVEEAKRCLQCDLPIMVDAGVCNGCQLCALHCSLIWQGIVNPTKARIIIQTPPVGTPAFSFIDECNNCGLCVAVCPYGTLTRGQKDIKA